MKNRARDALLAETNREFYEHFHGRRETVAARESMLGRPNPTAVFGRLTRWSLGKARVEEVGECRINECSKPSPDDTRLRARSLCLMFLDPAFGNLQGYSVCHVLLSLCPFFSNVLSHHPLLSLHQVHDVRHESFLFPL